MLSLIPKELVQSFIRHALTTVGGIMLSKGWIDQSMVDSLIGLGVGGAGILWAYFTHTKPPAGP